MARLNIYFFNVGHGDCTYIEFPSGRNMLVDINSSKSLPEGVEQSILENFGLSWGDWITSSKLKKSLGHPTEDFLAYVQRKSGTGLPSLVDPVDELKKLGVTSIFRYVQTHPDMDHMSGLFRLHAQERISITNFWDTANEKVQDFDSEGAQRFDERDWEEYQTLRASSSTPKVLNLFRGASADYFREDGVSILAPTKSLCESANKGDHNRHSYVLLIQYQGRKIVLGGDADEVVWRDIIADDTCAKLLQNVSVLKASHHGRDTGFYEEAVKLMSPQWTVCSIGKKPKNDAHKKYSKYTKEKVLSTRYRGNITISIDETGVGKIKWSHNA